MENTRFLKIRLLLKLKAAFILAFAILFLSSCGGGSSSGSSDQTVTVTGSLGLIQNAEAMLMDIDMVPLTDPVELDDNSQATFTIPNSVRRVIAVISGDADANYFDEATQSMRPFNSGQQIRAIVSNVNSELAVTTFTELAVAQLENEIGGLASATAQSIDDANESIRTTFLQGLDDITQPPTVVSSASDRLGTSQSDLYAAMLAAYAELANGELEPALSILTQLRNDLSDGVFDGNGSSGPLPGNIINPSNIDVSLESTFNTVINEYGNGSLILADLQNVLNGVTDLIGEWTVSFSGEITIDDITEAIDSEIIDCNLPAELVPTQNSDDFSALQMAFDDGFVEGFSTVFPNSTVSNVTFEIISQSASRVEAMSTSQIFIPAQIIDGLQFPATNVDVDIMFVYTRND